MGPAGPAGERGEKGLDGAAGERGPEGQNGLDGRDGIDGKDGAPGPQGEKGVDGINGKDGRDGIDFTVKDIIGHTFDGERRLVLKFGRDGVTYDVELDLPIPVYRDVWTEGKSYTSGDLVTWGGGMYIAKEATTAKPGMPTAESRAWKLCVKAGRDGKQGPPGPSGPQGMKGEKGEKGPDRW